MRIFLFSLMLSLIQASSIAYAQSWQSLDSLGQTLITQQKYKDADSILRLALKKVELQQNKDTSYAKVALNLGTVLFYKGSYPEAEQLWSEAKQIIQLAFGKNHFLYARCCNRMADLYRKNASYIKAEPLYLEAKAIRESIFGKKHTEYAYSCNSLALFYIDQALYEKAESLCLEAKGIYGEVLGKANPDYARSCYSIAALYYLQGLYKEAEPLFLEARDLLKNVLNKKNTEYENVCNNLANLYLAQGYYDKSEELFIEVKSNKADVLGKKHHSYANSCNNLAALYFHEGLYDRAEPLYWEAKSIFQETFGKKSVYYASSCNNLANLYKKNEQHDRAELLYMEAKGVFLELLGKQHPTYAAACSNLANLYSGKAMYDKAEEFYMEAGSIIEKVLGKKHPDYTNFLNSLATIYLKQGFYDKSEEHYIESKNTRAGIFGKKHPLYAESCNDLAHLYIRKGLYAKAEPLYMESIQNKCEQIENLFPSFSEQEKQAYWQSVHYFFDNTISFSQFYVTEKPEIMATVYDQTLFTKGIIFSSTQKMKNAILNSGDTVLVNRYDNWKKQREIYTKLYQLPLDAQKEQNLDLESMKNKINDLERELSKKSALFSQNTQTKAYKWQEVKNKLAKNEVVIEIIKADSAYMALFLTAQTEDYPAFHIFKNAQELEDKFLKYYKNCIEFKIDDTVSYNAFWKPIADKLLSMNLKGFKKIYFSPDGVFHQLSLNTLKNTKTNQFLLEEANIQLIGSSRDLIELRKKSRDLSQNYEDYQAYLLGYPIYGAENEDLEKKRDRAAGFSSMQSAVGVAGSVSLLPGTKKEVENVFGLFNQKKLKVNLLLAENATEEALKNLKSPTILHVATHGFFIPEIEGSEVQNVQTAMNRNLLKNAFMRSGLLLAGCQKPNQDGEDGILTAEEVMNLTLDNTELVVMSACETGLGDIQTGEGVFGLQRAFQQAGAKSVLMSLWKIDDEATQTLMTEFYTALLKGQNKRQAFKTAQKNLKKRFPEPYYWGAFVLVGE